MKVQDYLNVLWKRWWVIALVAVTAAVAALAISYLQTPLFKAHTEYSVTFNRLDSGAALSGANATYNDYRNQVYNPDQLESIAQELQLDKSGDQLLEFVDVQPQPANSKFVIETEYYSVADAQRIAQAVGDRLNAVVVESNRILTGQDRLSLSQTLKPRFVSYTPNKKINVLAGGILGVVLGVLVAFVLEYLDDTLKTASDVERFSGLPTLGSIPGGAAQGGRSRLRVRAGPRPQRASSTDG